MRSLKETKTALLGGEYDEKLKFLYVCSDSETKGYAERYVDVIDSFVDTFGEADDIALFSAPGRTEIGGNHTDHQHGRVLAGSVNIDIIAAARPNGTNTVRIQSRNYKMDVIDLDDLEIHPEQYDKAIALIRGVIKRFTDIGVEVKGFDAYTISNVPKGSGVSSSAAFEVLIGTILSGLYNAGEVSAVEIAKIAQYAENAYFGKPSGLMDQMASSVGGFTKIDFCDPDKPEIEAVSLDLAAHGHSLCIIDTKGNHADLTPDYAAIPSEMKAVAGYFGKGYLRELSKEDIIGNIASLREAVGDRAVLRALHFMDENVRVDELEKAIENGDFAAFLDVINRSGESSYKYLQNVYACAHPDEQGVSLALYLAKALLSGEGACRVHGGGFAGTIQAFVPKDKLEAFVTGIEEVFGNGSCYVLNVRPFGGIEVAL